MSKPPPKRAAKIAASSSKGRGSSTWSTSGWGQRTTARSPPGKVASSLDSCPEPGACTRCSSRQCRLAGSPQFVVRHRRRPTTTEHADREVLVDDNQWGDVGLVVVSGGAAAQKRISSGAGVEFRLKLVDQIAR